MSSFAGDDRWSSLDGGLAQTVGVPPSGLVVLSSGWSGDRVLVRLLSSGGAVRVVGQPLDRPVRDPAGLVRRVLAGRPGGPLRAAIILPHHLWLLNDLDATAFVAGLREEGHTVLCLARRHAEDRGLSLALCGPRSEVLPRARRHVDAADVALYAHENQLAVEWFGEVVPDPTLHLVFEDDLATPAARAASTRRLSEVLGLAGWDAAPDREVPDNDSLWQAVAQPEQLRAALDQLQAAARG